MTKSEDIHRMLLNMSLAPISTSIAAYKTAIKDITAYIDELEGKQVPIKPKETDTYPHRLFCPTCYFTFCFNKMNIDGIKQMQMYNYCPDCGQAIDWEDEDGLHD